MKTKHTRKQRRAYAEACAQADAAFFRAGGHRRLAHPRKADTKGHALRDVAMPGLEPRQRPW